MIRIEDIRKPIAEEFRLYEKAFEDALSSDNALLHRVLQYIHAKRGKQLRPQLTLLAAQLCHGVTDKTIQTAVALELLHTASLIHDDVVDSSPMRRGAEAVHTRWSNKVAVLVGDYLLAKVIELVANVRNLRIFNIIASMGATLSSGELLQLHTETGMWISEKQYEAVIEQKTASLFAACMEAGAESSGATMRQSTSLREFGLHLGMCFQLKDDVFDYSDSDDLGKPTMNDIRDGKATLPLIIALSRADRNEAEHIRQLAEDLSSDAQHIDIFEAEQEIKSFVMRYDGVRYAYRKMQEHKIKAVEALNIFHDSSAKSSLLALLDYTINRVH